MIITFSGNITFNYYAKCEVKKGSLKRESFFEK